MKVILIALALVTTPAFAQESMRSSGVARCRTSRFSAPGAARTDMRAVFDNSP